MKNKQLLYFKMATKYYKITNEYEKHYNFQCVDGLNILNKPFEENGTCVPGGLYFTDIMNIPEFYRFGVNLREVTLPFDDIDFKMVKDPGGKKWRANKIILGKKYSLFDPETYNIFGLDITKNIYIVDAASRVGNIKFLEWFRNSEISLTYTYLSIYWASINGHIEVLEWWKNNAKIPDQINEYELEEIKFSAEKIFPKNSFCKKKFKFIYSPRTIDTCSANGQIDMLEWWKNSNIPFKYTEDAIDSAIVNGRTDVLTWWKHSGFELKHNINYITKKAPKKMIEWSNANLF